MAKEERKPAPTDPKTPDSLVKTKKKRKKDKTSPKQDASSTPPTSQTPERSTPERSSSKKKRKRDSISTQNGTHVPPADKVEDTRIEPNAGSADVPKKKKKKRTKGDDAHDTADVNVERESPATPDTKSKSARKDRRKKRLAKATESITNTDEFPPLSDRAVHLHGHLHLPLAPARVVRAMDDSTRHAYLSEMSEQCHDLLGLLHSLITAGRSTSDDTMNTLENQLTTDMVRLRRLPLSRQYVEISLWQRVKDFVRHNLASAEKLAYGAGEGGTERLVGILRHPPGDVDVHFNSFRDAYLKSVVETYQANLEKIQDSEGLDKEHVGFLIKSLEAGADLFGNVACWDRRRDSEPHGQAAAIAGPDADGGQL